MYGRLEKIMPHKDIETKLQYGRLYFQQLTQERRRNNLCLNCGRPARVGKTQCQTCADVNTQRLKERVQSFKRRAVEYLGGKCVDCGLQTDMVAVYDFHHVNPSEKDSTIASLMSRVKSWKRIQGELDKCVLLCANCHRIRHACQE